VHRHVPLVALTMPAASVAIVANMSSIANCSALHALHHHHDHVKHDMLYRPVVRRHVVHTTVVAACSSQSSNARSSISSSNRIVATAETQEQHVRRHKCMYATLPAFGTGKGAEASRNGVILRTSLRTIVAPRINIEIVQTHMHAPDECRIVLRLSAAARDRSRRSGDGADEGVDTGAAGSCARLAACARTARSSMSLVSTTRCVVALTIVGTAAPVDAVVVIDVVDVVVVVEVALVTGCAAAAAAAAAAIVPPGVESRRSTEIERCIVRIWRSSTAISLFSSVNEFYRHTSSSTHTCMCTNVPSSQSPMSSCARAQSCPQYPFWLCA